MTNSLENRVQEHFDQNIHEYSYKNIGAYLQICADRLTTLEALFSHEQPLNILDIGCGAGTFSDLILARFPNASVYALDNSPGMLLKNSRSARKHLVQADASRLPFESKSFDVINIDTLMHHLVSYDGYKATLHRIESFLENAKSLVRPGGVIAVREIYHESFFATELHARLIYEISSRKLPNILAAMVRAIGIRTANAGVCFLSRRQWMERFSALNPSHIVTKECPWRNCRHYRILGFRANGDYHSYLRFD